jgi:DNA-binding LacI/PurR family transcriptional regulator
MGADSGKAGPSVLDVARLSGVSPSTVCRVINKRKNVSEKARLSVLEACASLGFKKNAAASLLRLRRSDIVACLMPDSTNEMFIDKLYHLKLAVLGLGRVWRLHNFHTQEEALQLLEEIVAARPAAAILGCKLTEDARRLLDSNDIAALCYDADDPAYDSVALNRAEGVYEAISHVLASGRKRILALGFPQDSERGEGCVRALAEAGMAPEEMVFHQSAGDRDLFKFGYVETEYALNHFKFDAIMAINDACAIGALRRLGERGLKVPEDVAVIGFDDIMVSSFATPSLSTVAQPKELMAEKAREFLERRLAEPDAPRQFACLKTSFVKRESA